MIHFKFTRKNVRRLCVTMALIAPIVYLFGNLFFALNGAHGAFPFSADYDVVVSQRMVDFNQVLNTGESSSYELSGVNVVGNDGYFDITGTAEFSGGRLYRLFPTFPLVKGHTYLYKSNYVNGAGAYISDSSNGNILFSFSTLDNEFVPVYDATCVFGLNYFNGTSYDVHGAWFNIYDLTLMFDGDIPVDYASYFDGFSPYVESDVRVHSIYGAPDSSQYVFNQFFAMDNFVSQIGMDCLSDSPHGFAPFGSLFRYVDDVAFHMGGTQVGLMAYGYLYWCAHVLLFDVLFMMTTFFISFIERVGDRLGGNE